MVGITKQNYNQELESLDWTCYEWGWTFEGGGLLWKERKERKVKDQWVS